MLSCAVVPPLHWGRGRGASVKGKPVSAAWTAQGQGQGHRRSPRHGVPPTVTHPEVRPEVYGYEGRTKERRRAPGCEPSKSPKDSSLKNGLNTLQFRLGAVVFLDSAFVYFLCLLIFFFFLVIKRVCAAVQRLVFGRVAQPEPHFLSSGFVAFKVCRPHCSGPDSSQAITSAFLTPERSIPQFSALFPLRHLLFRSTPFPEKLKLEKRCGCGPAPTLGGVTRNTTLDPPLPLPLTVESALPLVCICLFFN